MKCIFARAGRGLLHFSGNSISIKSRGFAHNTPLLPIIPPLIPFPILIFCSPRAAACF